MRRHSSNTSSSQEYSVSRAQSDLSEGELNLRHYLNKLGLPSAFHATIKSVYNVMESRMWIIDNSLDMNTADGSLVIANDTLSLIGREKGTSRWSEQMQVVDFHLKMAARAWIPTKFWMCNKPTNEAQRYGICWGDSADWASERDIASQKLLKTLKPEAKSNPLVYELCTIIKKVEPESMRLEDEGKFVSVVICTQGVPINSDGESGSAVMREFIETLRALHKLPVRIVFRLVTNEKNVIKFYKKVDMDIRCDVLANYWEEAMEVYMHNPWLTYGIGLHRIREAGLGTEVMDVIDERPLSFDELHEWCTSFFVGEGASQLCHPAKDWNAFISDLQVFLKQEKLVWNPVKEKLCPWIDVSVLESIYNKGERSARSKSSKNVSQRRQSSHMEDPGSFKKPSSHRRRASVSTHDYHPSNAPKQCRRFSTGVDLTGNTNSRKAQSFHAPKESEMPQKTQSRRNDPEIESQDSTPSKNMPIKRQTSSFYDPLKSSVAIKRELQSSLFAYFDVKPEDRSLYSVIKDWSHDPSGKLRPLQELLFEAPVLLPPNNPLVKHHTYFDKWKTLHRDAFQNEAGDGSEVMVKKVARRCKIFLHPDKWPSDLNHDQKFLLQSIWDTFQQSELF